MIKIKPYKTINVTFRKIDNGNYIIIAHDSGLKKSHAVNVAYPFPGAYGVQLESIGLCFQYVKKYMNNARLCKELDAPLASMDAYYDRIDDLPVSYKEL